jgi:rhamnosyltransferase
VGKSRPFSVCAVVVTYFPDPGFERRIQDVLPQADVLVVVDNTPEAARSPRLSELAAGDERIRLILNRENVGLAAALNQGLECALETRCKWMLTLDQDTLCASDMVDTLIAAYGDCKEGTAVVGSNYLDPRSGRLEVPAGDMHSCRERVTVITSGSLVDTAIAREIGGFRSDYFIDQVDHEFCLRARARGYRVAISGKPVMTHSVGTSGGAWVPLLGPLPNHTPLRKYYITRNSIVTVWDYWRAEPAWCLRRLARLLLGLFSMAILERQRIAKIRAFAAGFQDGIRRRTGPCERTWLWRT